MGADYGLDVHERFIQVGAIGHTRREFRLETTPEVIDGFAARDDLRHRARLLRTLRTPPFATEVHTVMNEPTYHTAMQAAQLLHTTEGPVRQMIREGRLPVVRVGRAVTPRGAYASRLPRGLTR